mgnify:CR=1 FL=1
MCNRLNTHTLALSAAPLFSFIIINENNGAADKANITIYNFLLQLGMVHNKLMQGGLGRDQNTVALTAYVTIALLEANVRPTSYINRTHSVRD